MSRRSRRRQPPPDLTSLFDVLFIVIFAALIRAAAVQQAAATPAPPQPPRPPSPPVKLEVAQLHARAVAAVNDNIASRPTVIVRISAAGSVTAIETATSATGGSSAIGGSSATSATGGSNAIGASSATSATGGSIGTSGSNATSATGGSTATSGSNATSATSATSGSNATNATSLAAGKSEALDSPLLEHSPDPDVALAYLGDRAAELRICRIVAVHLALPDLAQHLVILAPEKPLADLPHALVEGLRRDVERCLRDQQGLAVIVDPSADAAIAPKAPPGAANGSDAR